MIKAISIQNFQSHKHSVLNFHKGMNVIVGTSDVGKTAVLRALGFVINNKPNGDAFRRHNTDVTSVKLFIDDHKITRKKGKENIYMLDDQVFKSFGANVPEEIKEVINMDVVNIQSQLERPFLLDESSGYVAKHFNNVANLQKIDTSIQNINSAIRKLNSETSVKKADKDKLKKDIKSFAYLKEFEIDLIVLEKLATEKDKLNNDIENLEITLESIGETEIKITKESKLLPLEKDIDVILFDMEEKSSISDDLFNLTSLLTFISLNTEETQKISKLTKLEKQVTILLALYDSKAILTTKFKRLRYLVQIIQANNKSGLETLKISEQLETQFHKEMGEVCILCEQKIK